MDAHPRYSHYLSWVREEVRLPRPTFAANLFSHGRPSLEFAAKKPSLSSTSVVHLSCCPSRSLAALGTVQSSWTDSGPINAHTMSLPAARIASSSRTIPLWARTFHSSSSTSAPRGAAAPSAPSAEIQLARARQVKEPKVPLTEGWKDNDFSEPPFVGVLAMMDIQESWELLDKVRDNDKLLRGEQSRSTSS